MQPIVHLCNPCFQHLVMLEYKTIATYANDLIEESPFGYRFMVISYIGDIFWHNSCFVTWRKFLSYMPHWVCQSGKKIFFLKQPTITTKKNGRFIKGCMPHGSSWIVLCKCHNQIHATKICSLFFNAPGCHLETWKFLFFHAVNTNHMPVSKQFFFGCHKIAG